MTTLLRRIIDAIGRRTELCLRTTFADASTLQNREGTPQVKLHFKTARAQWNTILFGHVGLLESYFDQTLDIDGDFGHAFAIAFESGFDRSPGPLVWLRNQWHELRFANRSIRQAKVNARLHYGLGAEFYGYWLDAPLMMYTCAYWTPGTRTIEEAQRNKLEHACRKIRLEPGESVVDIGCGFGGFMFYAWEQHGVHACGINTTTEQVDWLRAQI